MAAGRKIENEVEARRCLAEVSASGLEPREWARRHGIDGRSLNVWRINLARHARPGRMAAKSNGLVELVPTSHARASSSNAARYALEVDGVRVEFGDDFEESTLRRVLAVLRAC